MGDDGNRVDRLLMGEASVGSHIPAHLSRLCDEIGVRWAGTPSEHAAAKYAADQLAELGMSPSVEEFPLRTWDFRGARLQVACDDSWSLDARPCLFCPGVDAEGPLVDVGHGMPHELAQKEPRLAGCVALLRWEFEPFSEPRELCARVGELAERGAVAAITASPHRGRRMTHINVADWRHDPTSVPLPVVQTSWEDAARLRRTADSETRITLRVDSELHTTTSWNTWADLGPPAPTEAGIVLGAHHDTTPDSFGANDNGSGVAVMLETARLLSLACQDADIQLRRPIRFVSFGAEEQGLQGSTAFVQRHYGPQPAPRFMIALDELSTGPIKGVVLQFPELRPFIQRQLGELHEGLQCHVLDQVDSSSDLYPFTRRGVPSAILWRWRFVGRHPDTAYGHSNADTPDKVRIRELKEYAGLLSRLLLRLLTSPDEDWPPNNLDPAAIARRVEGETGSVFRTM